MESSFQSLEGMVDFVTINLSPFALAKELFFNCRVSNLVAAPAWNCEFAHATQNSFFFQRSKGCSLHRA